MSELSANDTSPTAGRRNLKTNVSENIRAPLVRWFNAITKRIGFVNPVGLRLEMTEMYLEENPHEPGKKQARIIWEIDVHEDMCDASSNLHPACAGQMMDHCIYGVLALQALPKSPEKFMHVSLTQNVVYHAPAQLGSRLRIVNTAIALGDLSMTAISELYDVTDSHLVASAVQVKMPQVATKM